ncbi:SDR family NAD(P)-dependent oxidoreductase [Streptomyces sp. NPDC006476]|uniref:SDR family NAD(P)-dependent oxidoreductase n=1 Tax=Streptomyces sp. NPDC006476 TaxID=3157175 RepID=UPI0033BAF49E
MSDFTGKVGLVTEAGSGIERAIASGLARRGAAVAVLDLDEAAAHEITGVGGRAIAIRVDIADETPSGRRSAGPSPSSGGWTWRSTTPASRRAADS